MRTGAYRAALLIPGRPETTFSVADMATYFIVYEYYRSIGYTAEDIANLVAPFGRITYPYTTTQSAKEYAVDRLYPALKGRTRGGTVLKG